MNNRPYVTGGVEGWNLVHQAANPEHVYEILQRTDLHDWVKYPHYALRVDGEWLDDQANTAGGLARLKERCHAMIGCGTARTRRG